MTTRKIYMMFIAVGMIRCGGLDDSLNDGNNVVTTERNSLNGDLDTWWCSSSQKKKLKTALGYLKIAVNSPSLLECAKGALMARDNGANAEAVINKLRQNMETEVSCRSSLPNGWDGQALIDISDEEIKLKDSFINSANAWSIAGLILHEVLHNKGFDHPKEGADFEYDYTVNQQVRFCFESGSIANGAFTAGEPKDGVRREYFSGSTELAHVGGGGGGTFRRPCAVDAYVTGFSGSHAKFENGWVLRALYPTCSTFKTSGVNLTTAGGTVGEGQYPFSFACPSGQVAVGIWGGSGKYVDRLGLVCREFTDVQDHKNIEAKTYTDAWGGKGGGAYERLCPEGMAIKAIAGRKGTKLDQIRIECHRAVWWGSAAPWGDRTAVFATNVAGTAAGVQDRRVCLGDSVFTGIWGRSGKKVDRLGGICSPLENYGGSKGLVPAATMRHITQANGGLDGAPFNASCPDGMVAAGLKVRSGLRIDRVRAVCVNPNEWANPSLSTSAGAKAETAAFGGNGGSEMSLMCNKYELVVGLESWSGESIYDSHTIVGLKVLCRRLY